MSIPILDPSIYGCPSRQYSYRKNTSKRVLSFMKGRPRNILLDTRPATVFSVNMELNEDKFAAWQQFWVESAFNGAQTFQMHLRMDFINVYASEAEVYTVRAIAPYSARQGTDGIWTVTLQVEAGVAPLISQVLCDVIYGGPENNLATDVVANDPYNNLPTDIIAPCPYVEPNPIA